MRTSVIVVAAAAVLLGALTALPASGQTETAERRVIASGIQDTLLDDGTEVYAWITASGTCLLICKTTIATLSLSSYGTETERAMAILKEAYRLAPDIGVLYCCSEIDEMDGVVVEMSRHDRKQVLGCVCDNETGACCQGSAAVVRVDDASLAHLRSCEALARSGFDKAVVYVQAAPSAWGVDSVISGFGAAAADWVQILSYADVPAGPGEPAAPCDRQVTILVAEVEECESQSDCYRVRATQELLGALFDRLCATMVVVILIEPDGSLLDATSLTPYLGGAFGGLYLTPLDGRAEQALALSELLDVPRGDGMGWLLAELRVLLFDAVYAGGRGG